MAKAQYHYEVGFDAVDALRIKRAAEAFGITAEQYIQYCTREAIASALRDWLREADDDGGEATPAPGADEH